MLDNKDKLYVLKGSKMSLYRKFFKIYFDWSDLLTRMITIDGENFEVRNRNKKIQFFWNTLWSKNFSPLQRISEDILIKLLIPVQTLSARG